MPNWQTVPIFGSWLWSDGTLRPGTYGIYSNAQVTSQVGDGIVLPKGLVKAGELNVDEAKSMQSMIFNAPANDDPDMFPNGWQLRIHVTPRGADPVTFLLTPKLADRFQGIDLTEIFLPPTLPIPTPDLVIGAPGGLARLDADGNVVNANGSPIGADLSKLHIQSAAASVWSVTHSLGRYPAVTIMDSSNHKIQTDVEYPDLTTVVIYFAIPTTGKVLLS